MNNNFIPLESIAIAKPCHAEWNAMRGDAQARFCASCEKHVYNLSGMTRREAEALILSKEGAVCVRFYRRADGTILTDNCPVGLRPARNGAVHLKRVALAGVAACVALIASAAYSAGLKQVPSDGIENVATEAKMGEIAAPQPSPTEEPTPTPKPTPTAALTLEPTPEPTPGPTHPPVIMGQVALPQR